MAEDKKQKPTDIKDITFEQLVDKYSPYDDKLSEKFAQRFSNKITRASRISEFKRRVLAAHPNILAIKPLVKFHRKGAEYKEFQAFQDSTQPEKYKEWQAAKKAKHATLWQHFLSEFTLLPDNLMNLKLSKEDSLKRKEHLENRQESLDKQVQKINGNEMIQALSNLESKNNWAVICALLLATGRRTSELLKFGNFEVIGKYEMSMSGQLKAGLQDRDTVKFPTLAPAQFLLNKINQVRAYADVSKMTAVEINSSVSSTLSRYSDKLFGTNPHSLRAIYANMANEIHGTSTSTPRFIADILGHVGTNNASFYQRIKLDNYNKQTYAPIETPQQTKEATKDEKNETKDEKKDVKVDKPEINFIAASPSDVKNKAAMLELVADKKRITQTSIKAARKGGDPKAIKEFIAKNKAFVDAHNNTFNK